VAVPAEAGNHAVIDYVGTIDGEPIAEGRDQLLELGSERLIPGLEEQLIGMSAGDQRTVELDFPNDYPGELAGKHASFDVAVKDVKAKRLPELDDEFAAEAAGFDTLDELRDDIATRLQEADERAVDREFEQAVLDAAVDEAQVEVPDKLVHSRAHELLEQTLRALARQGISKEAYLRIAGKDEETLAREAEPDAARALRREAVLAAVVELEQIEPTDEQIHAALEPSAERAGTKVERLLEQLRSSGRLDRVREDVATTQALELLVHEAKPIPVEQAKARDKLWTPGKESGAAAGQIWTPGSGPASAS
jgi:trigger factor